MDNQKKGRGITSKKKYKKSLQHKINKVKLKTVKLDKLIEIVFFKSNNIIINKNKIAIAPMYTIIKIKPRYSTPRKINKKLKIKNNKTKKIIE
jgi:hypothetical protein